MAWTKFGKDEWAKVINDYIDSSGDVMTIKPGYRKWIYELASANQNKLGPIIQQLGNSLQEIISLVGWNLDADLPGSALQARNTIRLYRGIPYDNTDEAQNKITEHLVDLELYTGTTRRRLIEISES